MDFRVVLKHASPRYFVEFSDQPFVFREVLVGKGSKVSLEIPAGDFYIICPPCSGANT